MRTAITAVAVVQRTTRWRGGLCCSDSSSRCSSVAVRRAGRSVDAATSANAALPFRAAAFDDQGSSCTRPSARPSQRHVRRLVEQVRMVLRIFSRSSGSIHLPGVRQHRTEDRAEIRADELRACRPVDDTILPSLVPQLGAHSGVGGTAISAAALMEFPVSQISAAGPKRQTKRVAYLCNKILSIYQCVGDADLAAPILPPRLTRPSERPPTARGTSRGATWRCAISKLVTVFPWRSEVRTQRDNLKEGQMGKGTSEISS